MIYYHASGDEPSVGTVFSSHSKPKDYEQRWSHNDFYTILEAYREAFHPEKVGHKDGVFVCDDLESVDLCGGHTDKLLLMRVHDSVSWHDLNWASEISCLISEGYKRESQPVIDAAKAYWGGQSHPDESVWEGIVSSATVVAVMDYDTDDDVVEQKRAQLLDKISQSISFTMESIDI